MKNDENFALEYYKNQLEIERNERKIIENQLKEQLEFSLRTIEKISQECDRSLYLTEKMKFMIEKNNNLEDQNISKEILEEIKFIKKRNQILNHQNQKYRSEIYKYNENYNNLRIELANLFEYELIETSKIPFCANYLINSSKNINTNIPITIINALKESFDNLKNEILKKN